MLEIDVARRLVAGVGSHGSFRLVFALFLILYGRGDDRRRVASVVSYLPDADFGSIRNVVAASLASVVSYGVPRLVFALFLILCRPRWSSG
jgi:hypothetical protein